MSKRPEINNITEPVYKLLTKETKEAIASAIQADKDIISQCIISDEDKTIRFPDNVLPLRVKVDGDNYFFSYLDAEMFNDNHEHVGDIIHTKNYIEVQFDNVDATTFVEGEIDYIFYNAQLYDIASSLDTYYIYHPITSGGTKLYRHTVQITVDGNNIGFTLVSNNPNPINVDLTNLAVILFSKVTFNTNFFYINSTTQVIYFNKTYYLADTDLINFTRRIAYESYAGSTSSMLHFKEVSSLADGSIVEGAVINSSSWSFVQDVVDEL